MTSQVKKCSNTYLHRIFDRLNEEIENRSMLISTDESHQKINEAFLILLKRIRDGNK